MHLYARRSGRREDRTEPSPLLDRWVVRPMLWAAFILAILLLVVSSFVFWVRQMVMHLGLPHTQTDDFEWPVFGGQATTYLARAIARREKSLRRVNRSRSASPGRLQTPATNARRAPPRCPSQ
jgi:hypothetical protein